MAGLLDFQGVLDDPRRMGLLQLAAAIGAASGPSVGRPTNVMGGVLGGLGAYGETMARARAEEEAARANEMRRRLIASQIAENEAQAKRAELGEDPRLPAVLQIAGALESADPKRAAFIREALRGPTMAGGVPWQSGPDGLSPMIKPELIAALKGDQKRAEAFGAGVGKAETSIYEGTDALGRPSSALMIDQLRRLGLGGTNAKLPSAQSQSAPVTPETIQRAGLDALRDLDPAAAAAESGQGPLRPIQASEPAIAGERTRATEGAKADIERAVGAQKQVQGLDRAIDRSELVIKTLDDARKKVGFFSSGFTGARLGKFEGTDAYNLKRDIDTALANIGFRELQNMRFESPTGGALGQVAIQELAMLQATLGSLDIGQDKEQLKQRLAQVREQFVKAIGMLRRARDAEAEFAAQHGRPVSVAPENVPPTDEMRALRKKYGLP